MDEEMQKYIEPSVYVAVVAPVWLQNALVVFLHSAPALKLVACTATVQVLLALDLEHNPELIILETDKSPEHAQEQIKRIKAAWPAGNIIALIPHKTLEVLVQAAGADEILSSGTAPEQVRLAIARLTGAGQDAPTNHRKENSL